MELASLRHAFEGQYVIVRLIAQGGMASVYLAHDEKHDRDLAIKVLRPDLAESVAAERFIREIRLEGQLQHPHILPIYDSGSVEGLPYYVMPYVEGETLRHRLAREGALPIEDALRIAAEICDALSFAHRRGVVHRDIKPGNVLLSGGHAVVADFGLATAIAQAGASSLTHSGIAVGTPAYMSPEQGSGEDAIDARSDVYAIGCVLFEMLAGQPPFRGPNARITIAMHRHQRIPPLRGLRPDLPQELADIVERALSKDPAERYHDASALLETITSVRTLVHSRERTAEPAVIREGGSGPAPISTGTEGGSAPKPAPPKRLKLAHVIAGLIAAGLVTAAILIALPPQTPPLDVNKVVVFPFWDAQGGQGDGLIVADMVRNAIDLSFPLRADDGWGRLDGEERSDIARLSASRARSISRARGAGFYIDGRVVRDQDALRVTVLVKDVEGDSIVAQSTETGAAHSSPAPVGLRALVRTLADWLGEGRNVDLSLLLDRKPEAIMTWMRGEREYRFMRFDQALSFYEQAVNLDSLLVPAALKGAQAASWEEDAQEADRLVTLAEASGENLPPQYRAFLDGLRAYLSGRADSAVAALRRALAMRGDWAEAWMLLGDTYYHLMPAESALDSLAVAAFRRARQLDPSFTPPLFHLAERAILSGDLESATQHAEALRATSEDGELAPQLALMLACARDGSSKEFWDHAMRDTPEAVLGAAQMLASGGHYPQCAEQAARAVIGSSRGQDRWGAHLVLQGLLTAQARYDELDALIASEAARTLPLRVLVLLNAAAAPGLNSRATRTAADESQRIDSLAPPNLWLLGQWKLAAGDLNAAAQILMLAENRTASSRTRRDSAIVSSLRLQLLAARDTSRRATDQLARLNRNANRREMVWNPWEAFDRERLLLAERLLAQGDAQRAFDIATEIDSHRAVVHLVFLPWSLDVRIRAANALGRMRDVNVLSARLARLRSDRAQA
jgi:serine/threonine-protein kinase